MQQKTRTTGIVKSMELTAGVESRADNAQKHLLKSNPSVRRSRNSRLRMNGFDFNGPDAASSSKDLNRFFSDVHKIVSELMYAKNFLIVVYDDETGIISSPYFSDEKDEVFTTKPEAFVNVVERDNNGTVAVRPANTNDLRL